MSINNKYHKIINKLFKKTVKQINKNEDNMIQIVRNDIWDN